jgi:hypothetical protein
MEELKAMFRVCNAIKNDGVRCGSPALTGINFCWQHMGGKVPSTRAKATTSANAKLKLAYPGDRQAIQHNLFLVAQALNDGKIDTVTANTFNRIYRTCELNLRQWEKAHDGEMLPLPDETPEACQEASDQDSAKPCEEIYSTESESHRTESVESFRHVDEVYKHDARYAEHVWAAIEARLEPERIGTQR